ncbi:MAG: dicarboxylate/amino acid:cation symporter [Sphingobium sp.]|jgi:Na+/H+-dicarboxylate symporter|nr:dicarboxylate/amino acid:cation symporter [Sphingobium sp.]MCP5398612.1 dicarboxylate/amino acid:cation symporter [Sphingomonas sp.]
MQKALIILASLIAGLLAGMAAQNAAPFAREIASVTGTLWLNALRMTVMPLVIALLITGIVQTANAASAGKLAGKAVAMMIALLWLSSIFGAMMITALLELFPVPPAASDAIRGSLDSAVLPDQLPHFRDFLQNIIPTNIFGAAAEGAMLPVILFTLAFAFALTRLTPQQRAPVAAFFESAGNAMILIVGWVLWLAPVGVFALAFSLGHDTGADALGGLAHYVLVLVATGGAIALLAILLARMIADIGPLRFLRASIPAQAVAISTQSSLATLPAMLTSLDDMKVRRETSEVVLPLAVAIFRITSPAFNLGVALYIAHWLGIELSLWQIGVGIAVAAITTLGSVSLPGSVSFIGSIAPICLAMGLPIEPLGLLVAIETFPDIMRTLGNVTANMALTASIDRRNRS